MTLRKGRKVFYPTQGPCRVDEVISRQINGEEVDFYHLVMLDGEGGELYVPVDKIEEIGVRPLVSKSQVPRVLRQLRKSVRANGDWKQRAAENMQRLASGSPVRLARVVKSLTELRDRKKLSPAEAQTLERARALLISEIAEAQGIKHSTAEAKVDRALA